MNKSIWCFPILLVLSFAATSAAFHHGVHTAANKDNAGLSWSEYMSSMNTMQSAMASVVSSENSDADFVRLMLPHHRAAIDMARIQLLHGKDPQICRLAQEIITDQQSEIELMRLWLKQQRR